MKLIRIIGGTVQFGLGERLVLDAEQLRPRRHNVEVLSEKRDVALVRANRVLDFKAGEVVGVDDYDKRLAPQVEELSPPDVRPDDERLARMMEGFGEVYRDEMAAISRRQADEADAEAGRRREAAAKARTDAEAARQAQAKAAADAAAAEKAARDARERAIALTEEAKARVAARENDPADYEKMTREQLDDLAGDRDIDVSGAKNKGDVIALLERADKVDDAIAASDYDALTVDELKWLAGERGIDASKAKVKADYVALFAAPRV